MSSCVIGMRDLPEDVGGAHPDIGPIRRRPSLGSAATSPHPPPRPMHRAPHHPALRARHIIAPPRPPVTDCATGSTARRRTSAPDPCPPNLGKATVPPRRGGTAAPTTNRLF